MNSSPAPITDWLQSFRAALATIPDHVEIPPAATPEGQRLARFRKACPSEFQGRIDRTKLTNPAAFDQVADWNGQFPGPCAAGATGSAKTRAAWSALGRLFVRDNKPFKGAPVRDLLADLQRYADDGNSDEWQRQWNYWPVLFIDDADKLNWDFQSQAEQLFAFYDWVYRTRKPVITTTNQNRDWWANKMGEAFARRLFDDAHVAVEF